MFLPGDLIIDSSNGERAKVNWVRDKEAGISYLDEPWHPGSMVRSVSVLLSCEEEYAPKRFDSLYDRVDAVKEHVTRKEEKIVINTEDALIKLLMS